MAKKIIYDEEARKKLKAFVGSYRSDYSIIGGFFTETPYAILGLDNKQVGIEQFDFVTDSTILVENADIGSIMSDLIDKEPFKKDNNTDYVNRFVAFSVNDLQPNEERVISFYRIMIDNSDKKGVVSIGEWANKVSEIIRNK